MNRFTWNWIQSPLLTYFKLVWRWLYQPLSWQVPLWDFGCSTQRTSRTASASNMEPEATRAPVQPGRVFLHQCRPRDQWFFHRWVWHSNIPSRPQQCCDVQWRRRRRQPKLWEQSQKSFSGEWNGSHTCTLTAGWDYPVKLFSNSDYIYI